MPIGLDNERFLGSFYVCESYTDYVSWNEDMEFVLIKVDGLCIYVTFVSPDVVIPV